MIVKKEGREDKDGKGTTAAGERGERRGVQETLDLNPSVRPSMPTLLQIVSPLVARRRGLATLPAQTSTLLSTFRDAFTPISLDDRGTVQSVQAEAEPR